MTEGTSENFENMFDEELLADEKQITDTVIDLDCSSDNVCPSQEIINLLKTRQPLLQVYDKLKHQKDNNENSVCLNLNFKPILAGNHERLDGKFLELVSKYRSNLITDILEILDLEVKSQTETISSKYKDHIHSLNANKATDSLKLFVDGIRKEKNSLDRERSEARAHNNTSTYRGRVNIRRPRFRGSSRGTRPYHRRPYDRY